MFTYVIHFNLEESEVAVSDSLFCGKVLKTEYIFINFDDSRHPKKILKVAGRLLLNIGLLPNVSGYRIN